MTNPPRQPRKELLQLDKRSWHLLALSLSITIFLALGIAAFFFPVMKWRVFAFDVRIVRILPQLTVGLLVLVILQASYIVGKQRELNELRNLIITRYSEIAALGADCPKDPLTGVLARRALPEVLQRESTWVDRYRIPLCLVLFDIRDFSKINTKEGNLAGDLVLKDLAQAIQATVRQTDSVLRYGPDEFLCILPRTDLAGGNAFTKRVGKECERLGRLRDLTLDIGTAVYEAGMDVNAVCVDAERDLSRRKGAPHPA